MLDDCDEQDEIFEGKVKRSGRCNKRGRGKITVSDSTKLHRNCLRKERGVKVTATSGETQQAGKMQFRRAHAAISPVLLCNISLEDKEVCSQCLD